MLTADKEGAKDDLVLFVLKVDITDDILISLRELLEAIFSLFSFSSFLMQEIIFSVIDC